MSFRNPILAGAVLIRRAIESVNFITGQTGWMIGNDGTAEFNGATFRGNVVIDQNNTLLMYSANPASGDLTISVAPQAGTDPFGNVYPAGLQILNHGGANASGIAISYAGTQPLMYFLNSVPNLRNDPALLVNTSGVGTAEFASFAISSAEDATQGDYVAISLDSSSQDGSSHVAEITDVYVDSVGGAHPLILRGPGGTTIYAGRITAITPGTGTSRANLATSETWHQIGATGQPAYGTGFAANAADQAPRFRLEALAGGQVRLDGTVATTAATAANAVIFTLPVGYRPTQRRRFIGVTNASGYTAAGATLVTVNTSGTVVCVPACSAAGQQICLDGITFPVD